MTIIDGTDCSKFGHNIGWQAVGGFPGHEHTHPTGPQVCLNCGKTLDELFDQVAKASREEEKRNPTNTVAPEWMTKTTLPSKDNKPEWDSRLRLGLDEIFEEAQSYTGPMSMEDETFNRVLAYTREFIAQELKKQREEINNKVGFLRQWLNEKPKNLLVTDEHIRHWLGLK